MHNLMPTLSNFKFSALLVFAFAVIFTLNNTVVATTTGNTASITTAADTAEQVTFSAASVDMATISPPAGMSLCNSNALMALTHSNTYAASDWDISFVQSIITGTTRTTVPIDQFIDLNGDGLMDYLFSYQSSSSSSDSGYSCVALNNGAGFTVVHRCRYSITYSSSAIASQDYYGDCAG